MRVSLLLYFLFVMQFTLYYHNVTAQPHPSEPASQQETDVLESLRQLQDNTLTGPIPEFDQSSLKTFDVSNNNLDGPIPQTHTLQSLRSDSFSGSHDLCGPPTPSTCNPTLNDTEGTNNSSAYSEPDKSSKSKSPTIFILFSVVGLVAVVLLLVLYFKKARKLKKMMKKYEKKAEGAADVGDMKGYVVDDVEEGEERAKVIQAPGKAVAVAAAEERGKMMFVEEEMSFELNDILKASAEGLGKGSFGHCYKATMHGREAIVVKRIRDLRPLTLEEFTKQLHIIADLKHPNLLPLLAYYHSKEEKLLVYKFAEKGNLFTRIHGGKGGNRIPFRWSSRLWAAQGIARAMEYLHRSTKKSQSVVPHCNLKSTNVVFDENDMVLVSDYGLSSLIAQPIASQRMVAYKSPEFQTSRRVTKKSDVWSYGCLLLELLTGKMSVYSAPPGINGVDLASWVHRAVREEWTAEIFDNEIVQRGAYPGMLKLLQIAMRCSEKSPDKRPEMTEVVREVENIKVAESEDESDYSVDQSSTDDSRSTSLSGKMIDER